MNSIHSRTWFRRRGTSFAEVGMALFVLGTCATLIAELATITIRQQRGTDRRVVAAQEAANVLDDLQRSPWTNLTAERASQRKLSPQADEMLPGGSLDVTIAEETQPRSARRIDVRVAWDGADGSSEQSVELSGWRFAP